MKTYLQHLRDNNGEGFQKALVAANPTPEWLNETRNESSYTSWFSAMGASLLQIASYHRPDFAPLLLERGAKLDLHSACALGDKTKVGKLIQKHPQALAQNVDSFHAIQFALRHPDIVELLLHHGVDPDLPIQKVAWFDWEEKAIAQNLADWRLIHMLSVRNDGDPQIAIAKLLHQFGADLKVRSSPFGEAGIHLAAIYNRSRLIRWFVESAGLNVDFPSLDTGIDGSSLFETKYFEPFQHSHHKTPLMLAIGEGQTEAVRGLLELGADVQARDSQGFTPAHYAAGPFWKEDLEIAKLLASHGANFHLENAHKIKPIDLAERKGYRETKSWIENQPLPKNSC